jgi:deoxyadenosine/deoxycytidine kinase
MFIAVEGCIGVGKSTVAKGLASCRGGSLLLEAFETNPFLRAFATNPAAYALETEFAFLLIHFHQLKNIRQAAGSSEVISDFHLGKDLLYEEMNISEPRVRSVFRALYAVCVEQIAPVDVMVCLSAPSDLIIERIQLRQRDFELELSPDYYVRLNEAYEQFFSTYPGKKIVVRMEERDFVASPHLFGELSSRVDAQMQRSAIR